MKLKKNFRCSLPLATALVALLSASFTQAANITWSGATNTWNTNTNWVGSALPVTTDSLFFGAPGAGGLSLNNNLTSGSFTVTSIVFANDAGAYVIGDGTGTANIGNTFVLGAPVFATSAFTSSVTNASGNLQTINTPFSMTAVRSFTGGADTALAGNISGTGGGIQKVSSNTLILSGTNTYTGETQVFLGVLRLDSTNAVPGGIGTLGGTSKIVFSGDRGVIGLASGDFTRNLGDTTSTVKFSNTGGWAAFGADRVVNLGGLSASVNWTTANTGLNSRILLFSHPTSTHTVDFQNPLDMLAVARTVQVIDGAAAIDAVLSGNITGIAGGNLSKTGDGTLALTGADNNYAGTTTVSGGTLLVNGTKSGTGAVSVSAGAALGGTGTINGTVTAATGGRIDLTNGSVGNLSLGSSLTLSGTAAIPNHLFFDLGNGAGGTDKIITTGAHAAATANGAQVHLNQLSGGSVDIGTYTLIQGGAASNFTGYTLATERAGRNLYSALGANGNNLEVTVAAGDPGPADPFTYWKGELDSFWAFEQWYSDAAGTTTSDMPGYSSNVRFATSDANFLATSLSTDFEINSLTVDAGLAATSISGNMLTIDATTDNSNAAGNGITLVDNGPGTVAISVVDVGSTTAAELGIAGTAANAGDDEEDDTDADDE
jgi:autotransporter-associated beta strand protein